MLIDCSYFTKGSRKILNASLGTNEGMPNQNAVQVCRTIEGFIDDYQEQFLTEMLGPALGNKVHTYLVCLEEDNQPKHIDRFDAVCDRLKESFADYVFYIILRDSNTEATITGLKLLSDANTYVAPIRRQVSTWNRMVDRNRAFKEWAESVDCELQSIKISSGMLEYINIFNL